MDFPIVSKLLAICLVSAAVVSCTCSNDLVTPREVEPTTKSSLRIVHASADAPSLRCLQNDKELFSSVVYEPAATAYASLPSELRNLRFRAADGATLLSLNVLLNANEKHTFVLLDQADRMRGLLLRDVPPAPLSGSTYVRIVHADVASASITIIAGEVSETLSFAQNSEWIAIPLGTDLQIIAQGAETRTVPASTLSEGSATTIIVRPVNGPGASVVTVPVS
jgi:hypothetical protein